MSDSQTTNTQHELRHTIDTTKGAVQINLDDIDAVDLEPASNAHACGAAGCTETSQLIHGVIKQVGQRVLCVNHMADLIRQEVLADV